MHSAIQKQLLCLKGFASATDELRGLVLLDATLPRPWERVALLRFGPRLGEPATRHVYLEVQGRWGSIWAPTLRKCQPSDRDSILSCTALCSI